MNEFNVTGKVVNIFDKSDYGKQIEKQVLEKLPDYAFYLDCKYEGKSPIEGSTLSGYYRILVYCYKELYDKICEGIQINVKGCIVFEKSYIVLVAKEIKIIKANETNTKNITNEFNVTGVVESIGKNSYQKHDGSESPNYDITIKCKHEWQSPLFTRDDRIIVHYFKELDSKIVEGKQVHARGLIMSLSCTIFAAFVVKEIETIESK